MAYSQGRKADAAVLFRELAEGGSVLAMLRLGELYERGEGVLQSFVEAVRWLKSAAEQGSVPAMARLGEIFLSGMAAPETATPAALVRLEEDPSQESLLKRLYPQGLAVPQDPAQAAHWNLRAALTGDAPAQARLGYQYASGLGQPCDLIEAERWFAAAANQGNSAGQLGLGMLYAGSYGERRDDAAAQKWLELCATAGNSTAQMCLAMLLLFSESVSHDEGRAAGLLMQAAKAGQPAAMFHLGELYRRGVGVTQSASNAETWLRRAATRGYLKAWMSLVQLFRYGPDADPNNAAVSGIRLEKPHSLSYQPITRANAPSTTVVCGASKLQEKPTWLKSALTSFAMATGSRVPSIRHITRYSSGDIWMIWPSGRRTSDGGWL